ncbi:hypothetical protein DVH02_19150 [Streptomyces corynorhini]|uniref:AMP-dependent synthetase/ligase domain-containing protein n=2 Tax=Streptomyces corynorhini TaxID=2282652 RepID=A0A370B441_9ACTN|nr:hypothetical protein DVH02_19150 [Streptomyces corynorhini]
MAQQLERHARAFPDRVAIVYPDGRDAAGGVRYAELTYGRLQERVERLAAGLAREGIGRGTRTVVMTRPGPDLYALLYALFRVGAVPVTVDPGMGVRRMLHCYRSVGAEAFIGPPVAHAVRVFSPRTFRTVRTRVTVGRRWFWGGPTLERLGRHEAAAEPAGPTEPGPSGTDLLMIGFTTGSTGPAKGVEYTHRMGRAIADSIRDTHGYGADDVSLITLPMYGVFDLRSGSTLVLAPVDPTKVAQADPAPLTEAMTRFRVNTMIASPALLRILAGHLERHPVPLPDLDRVIAGGAPTSPDVIARLRGALHERAAVHVTYGATEVLPIASIESAEIQAETAALGARGEGACVGRPATGVDIRLVRVTDGPLPRWTDGLAVAEGEIGEIAVAGDLVSARYHRDPAADAQHKIHEETADGAGRVWHRTGDLGHLDHAGRLWFSGRRTQRVTTAGGDLHTVGCEGVFHSHPLVRRTALVGVGEPGAQRPVLCVETEDGVDQGEWERLVPRLRLLAEAQPMTKGIEVFLRHPSFPVDVRHNAKIGREELSRWAAQQLASRGPGASAATGTPAARRRMWALRSIPLIGWAYLGAGLLVPLDQPVLVALWWIDAFLSVVVHAAQIPFALPRGRAVGRGPAATAALTMLYGAAWWKTLPRPAPEGATGAAAGTGSAAPREGAGVREGAGSSEGAGVREGAGSPGGAGVREGAGS